MAGFWSGVLVGIIGTWMFAMVLGAYFYRKDKNFKSALTTKMVELNDWMLHSNEKETQEKKEEKEEVKNEN